MSAWLVRVCMYVHVRGVRVFDVRFMYGKCCLLCLYAHEVTMGIRILTLARVVKLSLELVYRPRAVIRPEFRWWYNGLHLESPLS